MYFALLLTGSFAAFCYAIYQVFKRGNTIKFRLLMILVAFIIVPAFFFINIGDVLETEIAIEKERAVENSKKEREARLIAYCQEKIKERAQFPGDVDFDFFPIVADSGAYDLVNGGVNLKNAFGTMIHHNYICKYEGNTLIETDLLPG